AVRAEPAPLHHQRSRRLGADAVRAGPLHPLRRGAAGGAVRRVWAVPPEDRRDGDAVGAGTMTISAARTIRPPDPVLGTDTGLRIGPYSSAEAVRIILHCFFRDAHSAIDLTYGAGCFWEAPHPPALAITTNNIDPDAPTDLHVDYTAS